MQHVKELIVTTPSQHFMCQFFFFRKHEKVFALFIIVPFIESQMVQVIAMFKQEQSETAAYARVPYIRECIDLMNASKEQYVKVNSNRKNMLKIG